MKYDIFISYRRQNSFDTASLIAEKLRHAGYNVFFDVDTLNAGKFNVQLLDVIKNCKDFILILPANALDRCSDSEDWVRQEVLCAMQHNKNIIPVMLAGFEWPQTMPEGMEELRNYQAITSAGHDYFDLAMKRLIGYLKSKPSRFTRHIAVWGCTAVAVLTIILALLFYFGWRVTRTICTNVATQMSSCMGALDLLADVNNDVEEAVSYFFDQIPGATSEDIADLEKGLAMSIDKAEKESERYLKSVPQPQFNISAIQSIILGMRGIEKEELEAFAPYYVGMFDEVKDLCESVRMFIDEQLYNKTSRTTLEVTSRCFRHNLDAFYYAYMQQLSLIPQECRKTHYSLSGKWKNYPNGVPFGLSSEEYENFQLQEMTRMDAELDKIGSNVNYEEQQLDDMNEKLEQLDQQTKALEQSINETN